MSKYLPYVLILCLMGCSSAWHLRQAIKKGAKVTRDTVVMEVPFYIPEVRKDTVFESKQGDTVYITKDRLVMKYVKLPGDSVYLEGKCKPDTIYKEVQIPCDTVIEAGFVMKFWHWLVIVLVLLAVVGYVWKR
jgi:hypothetical protein